MMPVGAGFLVEASREKAGRPRIVVLSSLFPRPNRPLAGVFILERMRRVGRELPVSVISPVPWSPLDGLLRWLRPHSRPASPRFAEIGGLSIAYPRFFSLPGVLRRLDGLLMALCLRPHLRRMQAAGALDLIDAHFAYPDGYAAVLLGRWLGVPSTITLRGTEVRLSRTGWGRRRILWALTGATRVFAVSESLRQHAIGLGVQPGKVRVVPNGVDTCRFRPCPRSKVRRRLGIPEHARVLITVGGLVERKGQYRVIECMPALLARHPDLHYLIAGGSSGEGDWRRRLHSLVAERGVAERVHFLGEVAPDALREPLSAADVFVLATRNEGWANVILEAMACGLPVVASDVGGNAEIVADPAVGRLVPFGDHDALRDAVHEALTHDWDRQAIVDYARANGWEGRVERLVAEFRTLGSGQTPYVRPPQRTPSRPTADGTRVIDP